MKILCLLCFALMVSLSVSAETPVYEASAIPKELLPYAGAVIRQSAYSTQVKDLSNTIFHVKQVITVLNKTGDDQADIIIWHNKNRRIQYVKGAIYDEFGKLQKKFAEKDFEDYSNISSFSLFEDTRVKRYRPVASAYPYTLTYEYEVNSRQSLNFPDWKPNDDYGTALENSTYTFVCKPDFKFRYKQFNYSATPEKTTDKDGNMVYTWKLANQKAMKAEPYSPDAEQYLPVVKFAPEKFVYEGHSGAFTNWNELGKWVYNDLLSSRTVLPAATVLQMQELVRGVTDEKLKAKKVYEYMQQKTRYISVQIGIGGYQPFMAADVDKQSYGDCKALVNYTQALLKAVNINSYYCVVEAGSRKVSLMPDFASMEQGNHVILCLPFKNDTTWLECTSQQIPFGYLGTFTDDRNVLACTPGGGKILHTPVYAPAANLQHCQASFTLNAQGGVAGEIKTSMEGAQFDNRQGFAEEAYAEQVKYLKKEYPIDNLEIEKLSFVQEKNRQPKLEEQLKVNAYGYAAQEGDKYNFYVNATNRIKSSPREVRNRVTNVFINRGYTDEDEITYTIPEGYRLDNNPLAVKLQKPFGSFSATLAQQGNRLIYKRRMQIKDGTYDKALYQELVDFYSEVVDADEYRAALVKK